MKPTFALDLTRDTIALLHRTPKGWLSIGEVAFDAPDLETEVDYLRKTALGLSPLGVTTKIILPASQILYTEIHAPGPSRDEKRRQIAAGLEGRTPYAVEDLVFDWSGKGATVKVAVVARETLDEAESFAVTHRLSPVSYVAIPEDGTFVGEPWFGPTAAAASILAEDELVERDREAVVILQREGAPADLAPVDLAPVDLAMVGMAPAPGADVAPAADDVLPGLEEALTGNLPSSASTEPALTGDRPLAAPPASEAPAPDAKTETAFAGGAVEPAVAAGDDDLEASLTAALAEDLADAPATVGAATASANAAAGPPATLALEARPDTGQASLPDVEEAPFAHVTDTAAFPDPDDLGPDDLGPDDLAPDADAPPKPALRGAGLDAIDDDIPPALPSAGMVAFASRRSGTTPATTRPVDGALRPDAPAAAAASGAAKLGAPAQRSASAKGLSGLVTAPSIPGTRAKPKLKPSVADGAKPGGPASSTVRSPARPGGTFGASAPPRSRSGVVFMVLVALLLLCLALLAAWSSFYLARNGSDTTATTEVALETVPGVDDEMLADMQDPEGLTGPIPEADGPALAGGDAGALATESLDLTSVDLADPDLTGPDLTGVDAEPAPANLAGDAAGNEPVETLADTATDLAAAVAPEAALPVEPAPGTAVATELAVAAPPVEDQDEIFLSAMDAPPPALDALALPTPAAVQDAAPDAPMPPPAFGTVYQFDAQGLLMPTPEGILSPEGVMLIAGPPPLVPPARTEAAAALAAAALAAAAPAAPDAPAPAAAGAAASPNDASLVTSGDGGAAPVDGLAPELAPETPADPALAGFRPLPRPEGLAPVAAPAPEDDARLATDAASAVATLRPLARPATVLAAASAARPADAALAPADLGAQGASLAAQAEAQLAAAAALEAQNPSIVAISMRPAERPRDLSRAVEAAVAAAVRAPEPEPEVIETAAAPPPELKPEEQAELDEPEVAGAAPAIPTRANVAKQATFANAINLSKINLIGTYGTDSRRYALIRQSNGRYKKVSVGDKIDGGTVRAITETEVRYQKGGKLISLTMPKA